jgi:hypothetical protein
MTTKLNISYCKLDSKTNIVDLNESFIQTFNLQNNTNLAIRSVFNLNPKFLHEMQIGDKKSFMLFYNSKINLATHNNSILIMYTLVEKNDSHYVIRIINWLNYIHGISNSLEIGYSLMSKFNDSTRKTEFSKISDASCYKALYPLVTYLPRKSSNGVSQISLYEIMRVFVKLRDMQYSRDYARNVYSRIRTNLKQEYNLENTDVIDLIKNEEILNINFNGEIHIPYTTLVKNIILLIEHDYMLLSIIDTICPSNL